MQGMFLGSEKVFESLNEAYYGSNPLLMEAESVIARIKESIMKNPDVYTQQVHGKDLNELDQIFRKLFNFDKCIIYWSSSMGALEGFTIPLTYNPTNKNYKVEKGPYGVRYKDSRGKTVYMQINNYLGYYLEPDEILAVILHEIGHNFYTAGLMNHNKDQLKDLYKEVEDYFDNQTQNPSEDKYEDEKENDPLYDSMADRYVLNFAITLPFLILFSPFIAVGNVFKTITNPFDHGYKNEKFADNFAVSYGYGDALARTMKRFDKTGFGVRSLDKKADTSPAFRLFVEVTELIYDVSLSYLDEHPRNMFRISDQITKLEADLKKYGHLYDATTKKEIQDTLEGLKILLKETYDNKSLFNKIRFTTGKIFRVGKLQAREFIHKTRDYDWKGMTPQ